MDHSKISLLPGQDILVVEGLRHYSVRRIARRRFGEEVLVYNLGFAVQGSAFSIQHAGFKVQGAGLRV